MEPVLDPRVSGTTSVSAASWSAIIAGAVVAVAVSLVLLALGSGLGFASLSAWEGQGVSLTTFAITTAIWLVVMQWLSSAAGGYVAGRLRTRWIGTHPHEVFFRDTAHGFVTWSLATLLVAALLASLLAGAVRGGAQAATTVASSAAQGAVGSTTPGYLYGMDRLFRPATAAVAAGESAADARTEASHIIVQALTNNGAVSDEDQSYLAGMVAARTGVTAEEARRRVNDFISAANQMNDKIKANAEAARKAAAKSAIFTALALAIGAFIACLSAALGGRIRDEHP